MFYNDYVLGKKYFIELINESASVDDFNEFIKENEIDEFIYEANLLTLDEASFGDATSSVGKSIKRLIGKVKLKIQAKKSAQAYLDYHSVDLEEAKVKQSPKWKEAEGARKEQLMKAWDKKKSQLKDKMDTEFTRMDDTGSRYGVSDNIVSAYKTKAKLAGISKVVQLSQNILSDSKYAELKNTYDKLKITDKENQATLDKDEQDIAKGYPERKKKIESDGGKEIKSEDISKLSSEEKAKVIKDKDEKGSFHYFLIKTIEDKKPSKPTQQAEPTKPVEKPTDKAEPANTNQQDASVEIKPKSKEEQEVEKLKDEINKIQDSIKSDNEGKSIDLKTKHELEPKIKTDTEAANKYTEISSDIQKTEATIAGKQAKINELTKKIAELNDKIEQDKNKNKK